MKRDRTQHHHEPTHDHPTRRRSLSSTFDASPHGREGDLPEGLVITPNRELRYPNWKKLI